MIFFFTQSEDNIAKTKLNVPVERQKQFSKVLAEIRERAMPSSWVYMIALDLNKTLLLALGGRRWEERGYSTNVYKESFRLRPNPLPFYTMYTIFDRKGTPFGYLLLTNGTPFTYYM